MENLEIERQRLAAKKSGYHITKDFAIHVNRKVRKDIFPGFNRNKDIKTLVIHGTAGGHTLPWVEQAKGDRLARYKRGIGLFHYLIDNLSPHPDGYVIEVLSPDRWCYHSGVSRRDEESIGVELMNAHPHNGNEFSAKQLQSLVDLCVFLKTEYPNLTEFVGHGRNMQRTSNRWKNCPGAKFPWEEFQRLLGEQLGAVVRRTPGLESVWID